MQCPFGHFGHCIIKTFYSNPQCNPTSLCIKGLIIASKPTSDQKLSSKQSLWFKGKIYYLPGQHHDVALAQRGTCDLLPRASL